MVFSSILFLFYFLPVALGLYFLAPRSWRLSVLTVTSYVFYAWSDPRCLLLLAWVTVADYVFGNLLAPSSGIPGEGGGEGSVPTSSASRHSERSSTGEREPSPYPLLFEPEPQSRRPEYRERVRSSAFRKFILILSLTNSLGLLFWFKYSGFAMEIANSTLAMFGIQGWTILKVVLPLGISFYTFESISYVVDIYRGVARPAGERFRIPGRSRLAAEARGLLAFACYLAQFPHLVAGPIIRFQELETQLHRPRLSLNRMAKGAMLFSFGLGKKVLIADTLAPVVEVAFTGLSIDTLRAWYGAVAFAFQIYFDFSGYTDMAMGLAMLLGFRFPRNFNAPYRAIGVADFWRRWHMTLSRWLRDYLYISLGGNRKGQSRTMVNLLLTMVLGGIWHGAAWTFVLWGAYHGVWLALERAWRRRQPARGWKLAVATAATFLGVTIGWVFFRAGDVLIATNLLLSMFLPFSQSSYDTITQAMFHAGDLLAMAAGGLIAFGGVEAWSVSRKLTLPRMVLAFLLLAAAMVTLMVRASTPFLYFKF